MSALGLAERIERDAQLIAAHARAGRRYEYVAPGEAFAKVVEARVAEILMERGPRS